MNYILYKCSRCKYEFILPTEDMIKAVNEGRYINCAYCGSKHIKVENKYDKKELRDLIEAHVAATGSKLGTKVLDDFDYYLPHFKKLIPNEYKKMITLSAKLEEKGLNSQQAQMEAFYESIGAKH